MQLLKSINAIFRFQHLAKSINCRLFCVFFKKSTNLSNLKLKVHHSDETISDYLDSHILNPIRFHFFKQEIELRKT